MRTIPYLNYIIPKDVNNIYYALGYKFKYIPYLLAEDIANVMSYWKTVDRPGGVIGSKFGFSEKYRKFLYSIPFDLYKETTPYYMAVEIIKDLSSKYDLRKIEKAIESQDENFEFIEIPDVQNPVVDVDALSDEIINILDLDISKHISLDIINILKETENFSNLFNNNSQVELSKMTSYTQFKKIPKYKLTLPTFNYNFPLKNYQLKQNSPQEIIVFRDVSKSAQTLEKSFKALLLYFIKSYNGRKVIIHEFTNEIINTYSLNSINDIEEYYNKDITYYFSSLKFTSNYVTTYSECYIIASGMFDIYPKMMNCIVNGITKGGNLSLKLLCDNTKGKYITV